MIIKLSSEPAGQQVRMAVYAGADTDSMFMCGTLWLGLGEWQLIGAALLIGAARMTEHLTIITEGDREVTEAFTGPPDSDDARRPPG